jgi:radical SAM protein with 4Fe4S-binding SPASM domain
MRRDFLDVYTYAKRKGLLITLFTNGTTLTPRTADSLAEWRPFSVEITLYGATRGTYERVTGVPGSYGLCMRGIELLIERGLPLKLKTMVMTLNRHELWDMKALAKRLGVDFRFDAALNAGLGGGMRPARLRVPPEDVVHMDLACEERMNAWREYRGLFPDNACHDEHLYQCGAGLSTFNIDPYGTLSACLMSRTPCYNLRRGSFRDGWKNFMPQVRKLKRTRKSHCRNCEHMALCDQCPGWALLETGDQEEPVKYLCRIANLRAEAF